MAKTKLGFLGFKREVKGFSTDIEKTNPLVHKFLLKQQDPNILNLVEEYSHFAQYDSSIWRDSASDIAFYREVPQMLKDPIISSSLATLMETAFQANEKQEVIWVNSDFSVIKKELDEFHTRINWQTLTLTIAYNLLLWGNLPLQNVFNDQGELEYVLPIADFRSVTPMVYANKSLGYLVNGNYMFPYEYSYAQLQYYKNLGGNSFAYMFSGEDGVTFKNEFKLAPSYLSAAVQPWKSVKIIEDALLLNRMDQSNYYRLILVGVGNNVDAKPAIHLLNFYRSLFKKVRRISYDSAGMASPSRNQDFEIVLPQNDRQKVEIKDVGGQIEVRAIEDLDKQLQKLFASLRVQPWMIGYSTDAPGGLGDSPATLMDARLGKVAKTLIFSVTNTLAEIDKIYLQSRGFDVDNSMWSYGTVSSTILEDSKRSATLKTSVENLKTLVDQFKNMDIEYNKNYLVESVLGPSLSSANVDLKKLFDVKTIQQPKKTLSSFKQKALENTLRFISSSVLKDSVLGKEIVSFVSSHTEKAPKILISATGRVPLQDVFLGLSVDSSTEIDPSAFAQYSSKTEDELREDWDVLKTTINPEPLALLPISFPILIPKGVSITAKEINSGVVCPIKTLVQTPAGLLFQSKEDVITYFYLHQTGLTSCIVQNFIRTVENLKD